MIPGSWNTATSVIDGLRSAIPQPEGHSSKTNILMHRLDQLTLAMTAMWELLRDQSSMTQEDLLSKIREIDLRDGKEDGKLVPDVKMCKACNRLLNHGHSQCLYCGAPSGEKGSAFDGAM